MLLAAILALFGISFIPGVREFLKPRMKWVYFIYGGLLTFLHSLILFFLSPKILELQKDLGASTYPLLTQGVMVFGVLISILIIACGVYSKKIVASNFLFYLVFALIFISTFSLVVEILLLASAIYSLTSTY
jgi:hypothetical protein